MSPSSQCPTTDPADEPASRPRSRRLRVALGTWVAIEAQAATCRDPALLAEPLERGATAATRAKGTSIAEDAATGTLEQAAIEAAYAAIRDVEQRMHPHRDGSDLARINSARLHTPIEIHRETWQLLQLARRLHDLTSGVFDPCVPSRPGRLRDIELQAGRVLVCHAPVELDLGGIAKGHAIDRAIETLRELGCSAGLVNAGGDLRVFGERAETVLLRRSGATVSGSNSAGATYTQLQLRDAALAVSDLDGTDRPPEHQGYYNRTGQAPVRRYAAVTARTAAAADALTKCLLLCSDECAARALRELEAQSL
jgi:FAD:protein FMN transferase